MNKEKILQVLKESYENKVKVDKGKLIKFIEETTPFINTLEKDLDYYSILYYRLALVLDLNLEVEGMSEFDDYSSKVIGERLPGKLKSLQHIYNRVEHGELTKDRFKQSLKTRSNGADLAFSTKDTRVLEFLSGYCDLIKRVYNE